MIIKCIWSSYNISSFQNVRIFLIAFEHIDFGNHKHLQWHLFKILHSKLTKNLRRVQQCECLPAFFVLVPIPLFEMCKVRHQLCKADPITHWSSSRPLLPVTIINTAFFLKQFVSETPSQPLWLRLLNWYHANGSSPRSHSKQVRAAECK